MSLPLDGSYAAVGGNTQNQQRGYNVGWISKPTRPSGQTMSAKTCLQTEMVGVNCIPDHGANLTELTPSSHDSSFLLSTVAVDATSDVSGIEVESTLLVTVSVLNVAQIEG